MSEIADEERIFIVLPYKTDVRAGGDLYCSFRKRREFSCKWLGSSHNVMNAPDFLARKKEIKVKS